MSYNGWTNRATWIVNLWMGDTMAEMVSLHQSPFDASEAETFVLEVLSQDGSSVEGGLAADLLFYALSDVNWHELADAANDAMEDVA